METLPNDKRFLGVIRTLSDRVANQIAAGEVVERPASVIKELVENSLDAECGSVTVSFRNGGKSLIEIVDDGGGMSRHDALLAFDRHATSKIESVDDLKSVSTLGFRGEALPSIASVSRFTLTTCRHGSSTGVEVVMEGGKLKEAKDAPPIHGTCATVRDLFFNTPARRKFLRSESVESAHAQEAVTRQALSRPDVAFKLVKDGKTVIDAPSDLTENAFQKRISALFGRASMDELAKIEFETAGMRVDGFISRPGVNRASREAQYVFINGRFVRDRIIHAAILDGYRSLMPKGRHPLVFLRLTIPPERVDVNVSPTKTEVRFVDGRSVRSLVSGGIFRALSMVEGGGSKDSFAQAEVPLKADTWGKPATQTWHDRVNRSFAEPSASYAEPPAIEQKPFANEEQENNAETPQQTLSHFDSAISGNFMPVGQVFKSFLVLEDGERMLILDQHTAHERVLYERFTLKYREGNADAQELLFPVEIELSGRDAEFLKKSLDDFKKLGFYLDEFGIDTFILRAVPVLLAGEDHKSVILDILDGVARLESGFSFDVIAENAINIMACRGAVKAGDVLNREEIESLVTQLKKCVLPYTCPHGRPVTLSIDKDDLLKGFLRK